MKFVSRGSFSYVALYVMRCALLLEYSRGGPLLSLPTLLEYIGGGFGLTVASEDALLVCVQLVVAGLVTMIFRV